MPAKVNPVMLELLNQAAAIVRGNNVTIQELAAMGQFELNVMGPTIVFRCIESIRTLAQALVSANMRCLSGIEVDEAQVARNLEHSLVHAVPLKELIGYEPAAAISNEAKDSGRSIKEVMEDETTMFKLGLASVHATAAAILEKCGKLAVREVR